MVKTTIFRGIKQHRQVSYSYMLSYVRVGLLMSEGGCPVGGVGVRGCGEGEVGGSRAGRRALPGTGLRTPSSSLPGEQK